MVRRAPTPLLWSLIGFGLLLAMLGLAVPGLERLVLPYDLALAGAYWITGALASSWRPIRVVRKLDPVLSVGVQNRVTLEVEWSGQSPALVRVRDEAPPECQAVDNEFDVRLEPGRPVERRYTLRPASRGDVEFPGSFVRFRAPLGLVELTLSLDNRATAKVYPNVKAVREFELLKQKGRLREAGMRRSRHRGLGTEFESLREYSDDDFRFIDWKSTARRGRLLVKDFEQERNQAVFVCLDLGRHMLGDVAGRGKVDHALDAALMLFHAAERAGDLVGFFAFNDAVRAFAAPKRGQAQVAAVLKAAYGLEAEPVEPDYAKAFAYLSSRWKRRSLVVLFTDVLDKDEADTLLASLTHVRRHHLLLVVRVADPFVNALLKAPVESAKALCTRAAATWYTSDRALAASVLTTGRVATLEAEPQNLSGELVSFYFRVKEEARL